MEGSRLTLLIAAPTLYVLYLWVYWKYLEVCYEH